MRGNLPWQANANTPGTGHADQDDGCGLGDGFAAFEVSDKQHGDNTLTLLSNLANASVVISTVGAEQTSSTMQMNVRCWGQIGTQLLVLSFTGFDPQRSLTRSRFAAVEKCLAFVSADACQSNAFPGSCRLRIRSPERPSPISLSIRSSTARTTARHSRRNA
jgi:hypothetical protein